MFNWMKTYALHHLFYIILIVVGVVSFRVWLSEHDARVKADTDVQAAQTQVITLQKQIDAIPAIVHTRMQVVTRVVHDAVTPSQVVAAVPSLTDVPLATRAIPGNQTDVEVAAQPLMLLVGQLKTSQIEIDACQQTGMLQKQQLGLKDVEITALKKKPNFLHRLGNVAKAVGVGVGIGVLLGARL